MAARAGLTIDSLTASAAELADEVGFERVTVSELARRVGVKPASLYSHLRGSDDLRGRISVLALSELGDRLSIALAGRSGRHALDAVVTVMRSYAHEHPGRWESTQVRITASEAGPVGAKVGALMLGIMRGYDIPPQEQTHAVRLVSAAVDGFIRLQANGSFDRSEPNAEASWTRMIQALDTALSHWPAGAPDGSSVDNRETDNSERTSR
ncbi:transcriptional regulator, TetR family [Sanguibacter gelidistatuariae]|uniref:Transcriptional regulator, TetR family n=1 Tax=Sanguibacter gelidistatuariae TaxID=1814289 RepID=A0A1G6H4L1_9MICO|nr:TetR/AcrR family transcriptional regulator [Sanguibacter gelidistatuariae]SDB89212.1 transcriptional regulator, TetR family [Sanguibacter gelidistatuariae]